MSPDLYIQILLTLLLAFLSYQTIKKGLELDKKEKAQKAAKEAKANKVDDNAIADLDIKEEEPEAQSFVEKSRD